MRYEGQQLRSLLAAEYVLGTLRGGARRRYEQLRESAPALLREQVFWEARLAALGLKLTPIIPPEELWLRIERQTRDTRSASYSRVALLDRAGFWQGVALAAALAAIVMGVLLRQLPDAPDYVGIVQASQGAGLWMVVVDARRGELRSKAVGTGYPVPAGKDLELWLLVKDEAGPVSLGLLPKQGETSQPLDPELAARLSRAAGLAVSLEPAGGSTTGAPTGPVLFTAPPPLPT